MENIPWGGGILADAVWGKIFERGEVKKEENVEDNEERLKFKRVNKCKGARKKNQHGCMRTKFWHMAGEKNVNFEGRGGEFSDRCINWYIMSATKILPYNLILRLPKIVLGLSGIFLGPPFQRSSDRQRLSSASTLSRLTDFSASYRSGR